MTITIRKSVSKYDKENLSEILNRALCFVKNKYPNVDFSGVDVIFSGSFSRARYYRNDHKDSTYQRPCIQIPTNRDDVILYWKPSLGMVRDRVNEVGRWDVTCACIIHELTHHAQYEENKNKGEVETTNNELEYLKEFRPDVYELFMND